MIVKRVAFVSPTGWGNLGDAAIIESLIHGIRLRHPNAQILGLTQRPYDTTNRHAVPAFTCSGLSLPKYKMDERTEAEAGDDEEPSAPSAGQARASQATNRGLKAIPGVRPAVRALRLARAEMRHRRLSASRIKGFDRVVVAGGGQLDDFWGGPLGHPYTLLRWARIATKVGARYAVLSVGTGNLTPLSRLFVRRALALADYTSFRDVRSRELLRDPGLMRSAAVVPDLAYGLPLAHATELAHAPRPTIGISPMAYADPRVWPVRDLARYRRHIETLVTLTVRLVGAGHLAFIYFPA